MAQLIKLENYISRYQLDIYHYTSQFSRLKAENWQRIYQLWKDQLHLGLEADDQEENEESIFAKWQSFFRSRSEARVMEGEKEIQALPQTEIELKHYFLNSLFPFQLKWASTTINKMSFIDRQYHQDFFLKYFLQRIPDTHLLMYFPVFQLKNGTIEADIILISPLEIEIITSLEKPGSQTIIPHEERFWLVEENNVQKKILNPLFSTQRTTKIIRSILQKYGLEFPVRKVILSRTNVIRYQSEPYQTKYIDRNRHESWLKNKQHLQTPLKHKQLKIVEKLLKHSATTAVKRPEWSTENDTNF